MVDFKEDEVHIHITSAEDEVTFSFYACGTFHHMRRSYYEEASKSLQRFAIHCYPKNKKTNKKLGNDNCQACRAKPKALLFDNANAKVNIESIRNCDFVSGMIVIVNELKFKVFKNPPTVTELSSFPRQTLYIGCPIVPIVGSEFAEDYECIWKCESGPSSSDYVVVCTDKVYQPSSSALGCRIKLYCTAKRRIALRKDSIEPVILKGRTVTFYLPGLVNNRPTVFNKMISERSQYLHIRNSNDLMSLGNKRWNLEEFLQWDKIIQSKDSDSIMSDVKTNGRIKLRVLSYNILAEAFAASEQSTKSDIYGYIADRSILETEYRIQRVLAEVLSHRADVICLQECDKKMFHHYLMPLLGQCGYCGHYTNKISSVVEGCAMFVNSAVLRIVRIVDLPLKRVLHKDSQPELAKLYQLRPDLIEVIGGKVGTIGQICICRAMDVEDSIVVAVNTHLFYHPYANYVRVLQTHALMQAAEKIIHAINLDGWDAMIEVEGEERRDVAAREAEKERAVTLLDCINNPSIRGKSFVMEHYAQYPQQQEIDLRSRKADPKFDIYSHTLRQLHDSAVGETASKNTNVDFFSLNSATTMPIASANPLKTSIIMCGDLNSSPDSAVIEYLTRGKVSAQKLYAAWLRLEMFGWDAAPWDSTANSRTVSRKSSSGKFSSVHHPKINTSGRMEGNESRTEELSNELNHLLKISSKDDDERKAPSMHSDCGSCDDTDRFPDVANLLKFLRHSVLLECTSKATVLSSSSKEINQHNLTNFTPTFRQQLDYILYQNNNEKQERHGGFNIIGVAPLPSEEVLCEGNGGIPSAVFPSDHISIVADLELLG